MINPTPSITPSMVHANLTARALLLAYDKTVLAILYRNPQLGRKCHSVNIVWIPYFLPFPPTPSFSSVFLKPDRFHVNLYPPLPRPVSCHIPTPILHGF